MWSLQALQGESSVEVPMQAGSDSVLKRMSRRCSTARYRELVRLARSSVPEMNITTDVIVGFPGETEEEWLELNEELENS